MGGAYEQRRRFQVRRNAHILCAVSPYHHFSMWPLLKKDGLALQYGTLLIVWNYFLGYKPTELPRSVIKSISLVSSLLSASAIT